jgi:chloramphenicol 3-O phosphotransferase
MINKTILSIGLLLLLIAGFIMNLIKKSYSTKPGMVIILNGPSSVGKSSIIRAFQTKQTTPWLSIGIDNFFVGVLPPKFYLEDTLEHHAVMQGIASTDAQGNKVFTLKVGPEGQKVIKGMHRSIAAYAHAGNNVIVDYINYEPTWIPDLQEALHSLKVIWVGINASLKTIEDREKTRGTSPQGHARSHYHTVHKDVRYDLMINTDLQNPEETAQMIMEKIIKP